MSDEFYFSGLRRDNVQVYVRESVCVCAFVSMWGVGSGQSQVLVPK